LAGSEGRSVEWGLVRGDGILEPCAGVATVVGGASWRRIGLRARGLEAKLYGVINRCVIIDQLIIDLRVNRTRILEL
jgi:hypothetical protein